MAFIIRLYNLIGDFVIILTPNHSRLVCGIKRNYKVLVLGHILACTLSANLFRFIIAGNCNRLSVLDCSVCTLSDMHHLLYNVDPGDYRKGLLQRNNSELSILKVNQRPLKDSLTICCKM